MAIVSIKGAEVTNVFWEGKGLSVKESFQKRDGTEGASYYSVFFNEPHGLNKGDTLDISGVLGVRPSTYEKDGETKHGVDISVNSPRYENLVPGGAVTETTSVGEDEAPF